MGWLDHSTNNIILDAVLTDYGRQQLASGGSNFKITHYALGDDEIDYRIIKKYGRTVGKEKIEKNTPVFEALTNQNIALKFPLISYQNVGVSITTSNLPYFTVSPGSIDLNARNNYTATISIKQEFRFTNSTLALLQDTYSISLSSRFFSVLTDGSNGTVKNPDTTIERASLADPNRIVEYTFKPQQLEKNTFGFTVSGKTREIDNTVMSIYGTLYGTNQRRITSHITVKGSKYGTSIIIPITYTR